MELKLRPAGKSHEIPSSILVELEALWSNGKRGDGFQRSNEVELCKLRY